MKTTLATKQTLVRNEIAEVIQRWDKSDKSFVISERLQYQLFGIRSAIGYIWGQNNELYKFASAAITHIINTR